MSYPIAALGGLILLGSLSMAVSPDWVLGSAVWPSRSGQTIAASIRIVFGLILMLAAPASRYPIGLRIFGAVVFLAGIAMLFLPLHLWQGLFAWVTSRGATFLRIGGGVGGTLFGSFLIYAAKPVEEPVSDTPG